jgi:EPS-associated MarR family transcriptional regulator
LKILDGFLEIDYKCSGLEHSRNQRLYLKLVFHPEITDIKRRVSNSETRSFLSWQENQGIARRRAAQEIPQIATARAKKNHFRMETKLTIMIPRQVTEGAGACSKFDPCSNILMDENHLKTLKILEENPALSQRHLAQKLNLSLGKANFIINALIQEGYVKAKRFKSSNTKRSYIYYLTPEGIRKKMDLTYQFLKIKSLEFEQLRREIRVLEQDIKTLNYPRE